MSSEEDTKQRVTYLTDADGNPSSKRLWGSIILVIYILLTVFAVVTSIENTGVATEEAVDLVELLAKVACIMLTGGVVEKFAKK